MQSTLLRNRANVVPESYLLSQSGLNPKFRVRHISEFAAKSGGKIIVKAKGKFCCLADFWLFSGKRESELAILLLARADDAKAILHSKVTNLFETASCVLCTD